MSSPMRDVVRKLNKADLADLARELDYKLRYVGALCFAVNGGYKMPGYLVIWPCGLIELVELRNEFGVLTEAKRRWNEKVARHHVNVYVLYGAEQVSAYIGAHNVEDHRCAVDASTVSFPAHWSQL